MGRPKKDRRYLRNIAATVDYRGLNDEILSFVFRGCEYKWVKEAFAFLVGNKYGVCQSAKIYEEQPMPLRPRLQYDVVAEINKPNWDFCSLGDMQILIEGTLRRLHPCTVSWMKVNTFLNA